MLSDDQSAVPWSVSEDKKPIGVSVAPFAVYFIIWLFSLFLIPNS